MTIILDDECIENAERGSAINCPVARALNKATGKEWAVASSRRGTAMVRRGSGVSVYLPPVALNIIKAWDAKMPIKPATFEIDIWEHTQ